MTMTCGAQVPKDEVGVILEGKSDLENVGLVQILDDGCHHDGIRGAGNNEMDLLFLYRCATTWVFHRHLFHLLRDEKMKILRCLDERDS